MLRLLLGGFLLVCCLPTVWADDSQPLYIEITQQSSNPLSIIDKQADLKSLYQLGWRIPASFKANNIPTIVLPDFCHDVIAQKSVPNNPKTLQLQQPRRFYQCQQPLAGHAIELNFPYYNPSTSTLIKYRALNGEQHTRLLSPSENSWTLPLAETPSRIAKDYTVLGMQHIWAGTDHLLFILCLLWIAGSLRRVFITITGFTIAHSITLVLSALAWVRVPVPPVEAVIALSIVFLATEIVKDKKDTITWRYPIAVSSSFGLLHGFGFAAALADIGLPQTELLTGLIFFNIGVEVGQVIFAVVVLGLMFLFKRIVAALWVDNRWQLQARFISAYGIGTVASFWLVERCVGFID